MPSSGIADLLFRAGRVWTGARPGGRIDGVGVRDGRVVAVGQGHELDDLRGPRTRVVTIGTGLLVPAFHDAHVHPVMAGLARRDCDLSAIDSIDEWLAAIAAFAATLPPGVPLVGEGWTQHSFPGGVAGRELLDGIVPDRPVILLSRDAHSRWLNSAALVTADITRQTHDPPLGRIERDRDGEPSGTLQEAAKALADALVPPASAADLSDALRVAQAHLHSLGIAGWLDADVAPEHEAAYLDLHGRGQLTARAAFALRWRADAGLEQLPDLVDRRRKLAVVTEGSIRADSVKLFQDGVIESATAALLEPYDDAAVGASHPSGAAFYEVAELRDICRAADAEAFAVHVHAIGDRATREVLDALEVTLETTGRGRARGRHTIAHLELVAAQDVARLARLGVIASVQPLWACHDADTDRLVAPRLGSTRLERRYPFGSLARAGALLAFGSDWSVSTPDPLAIMDVAVRRTPPDDPAVRPLGDRGERLALEVALRAYTQGSATACGTGAVTGTIEVGKAADLVLLDADLLSAGVGLRDARVLMTVVGGRIVHEDATVTG